MLAGCNQKRPLPHDMPARVAALSAGQKRAALALIAGTAARTYPEAAEVAGVSLGTLHTHLRRLRRRDPDLYGALMEVRAYQLAERHRAALQRAERRSQEWHRRAAARRYYYRFGVWPWERSRTGYQRPPQIGCRRLNSPKGI